MQKVNFSLARFFKGYLAAIVVAIGVLIFMDGFVSIGAGEVGVVFDRGRGVLNEVKGEGLHIKIPFWQVVDVYSVRTREFTMSAIQGEGSKFGNDQIEARSKDGQIVYIDATILYNIAGADAPKIKQTLGSESDYDRIVVRPKSRSVIREVVANYNALDLVSENRLEVVEKMDERLIASFAQNGITLQEVILRNVTFSAEFAKVLEQKQVAQESVKIAEFKKQEAEQLKEKKIIEAEAEAEAIRLKGEILAANPEVIQLEFVQKMGDDLKWGILPADAFPFMNLGDINQ